MVTILCNPFGIFTPFLHQTKERKLNAIYDKNIKYKKTIYIYIYIYYDGYRSLYI